MDSSQIGIAIATRGRAAGLSAVVKHIAAQERAPDRILICGTEPADTEGLTPGPQLQILRAEPGLTQQRNVLLDAAVDFDILLFLDDDFLMAPAYLRAVAECFHTNPGIVGASGELIADDSRGPGLSVAAGLARIAADDGPRDCREESWRPSPHLYGCNMALRMATVRAHNLRFDERLPLYGWSEDIDFAHRLKGHGLLATVSGARGVHLGAKQGRSPGRRLGYSQVANPLYLLRKGSYSVRRAGFSVGRNFARNLVGALRPEPYVDRRGRLAGNLLALGDLCRGRMTPERVLDL